MVIVSILGRFAHFSFWKSEADYLFITLEAVPSYNTTEGCQQFHTMLTLCLSLYCCDQLIADVVPNLATDVLAPALRHRNA